MRELILDRAVELLRERGFDALSGPQIAKAAGITQGHLTYYFPRKDDLLTAVVHRSFERLQAEFIAHLQSGGVTEARDLARFLIKDRARTGLLMQLFVRARHDDALRAQVLADLSRQRDVLRLALGEHATELDVDLTMATLWGIGMLHLAFDGARADERTDELLDYFYSLGDAKEQS